MKSALIFISLSIILSCIIIVYIKIQFLKIPSYIKEQNELIIEQNEIIKEQNKIMKRLCNQYEKSSMYK